MPTEWDQLENPFRVGDLVVCVDNDDVGVVLDIGQTYRVTGIDNMFIGVDGEAENTVWLHRRFRLALGHELLRDDDAA